MLDVTLKYLSLITVFGAAISFLLGLLKYLDQRKREERTKRFELYHDLMRRVSAVPEHGDDFFPLTQQVAAVYELQQFAEYAYSSVPILEHLLSIYKQQNSPQVLLTAIEKTLSALQRQKA